MTVFSKPMKNDVSSPISITTVSFNKKNKTQRLFKNKLKIRKSNQTKAVMTGKCDVFDSDEQIIA